MEPWAEELRDLEVRDLRRHPRLVEGATDPRVRVDGRLLVNLASNGYLGLAGDPRVRRAAVDAVHRYGTGAGSSRLIAGSLPLHAQLEAAVARFKAAEDAVLFATGYMANLGVLTSLTGPGDVVFSDALNHASIVDGCRLSRAEVAVYRHRDLDHLENLLRRSRARRRLIVSDGVFSMDGDVAPLPGLLELADRHGALVLLDEAHATGVLGHRGRGSTEHFGLAPHPALVQVVTLSKALAAEGAVVTGPRTVVEVLRNRARPFIYSTAPAPAPCAAALAAIGVLEAEPWRVGRLRAAARRLRNDLAGLGLPVVGGEAAILGVVAGTPAAALRLAAALETHGAFAPAVRPPTVPAGTSRVRLAPMATHTDDDLDAAVAAFAAAAEELRREGIALGADGREEGRPCRASS
ncbi:MAG: 8-amino-7-oxononanoate synthase [Clostridia bacterium]|nr:8-amino-7-oxononanoate synthase [Clostridia bacterium]